MQGRVELAEEESLRLQQEGLSVGEGRVSSLAEILDGFEAELELERELGVRTVPFDRSLLEVGKSSSRRVVESANASEKVKGGGQERRSKGETVESCKRPARDERSACDFAFVHDRPLSQKAVVMMSKILVALQRDEKNTPIVVAPPLPEAKVYIVLGMMALKKHFPTVRGVIGQPPVKTESGRTVLVTQSPEDIVRFTVETPAVKQIKRGMWLAIKSIFNQGEAK